MFMISPESQATEKKHKYGLYTVRQGLCLFLYFSIQGEINNKLLSINHQWQDFPI